MTRKVLKPLRTADSSKVTTTNINDGEIVITHDSKGVYQRFGSNINLVGTSDYTLLSNKPDLAVYLQASDLTGYATTTYVDTAVSSATSGDLFIEGGDSETIYGSTDIVIDAGGSN